MIPSPTKTIGQVQKEFEEQGENSVHLGFRNAVEAMLRDGFTGSFSNDCYSNALVLSQKMLSGVNRDLRVLSGNEGDSFFKLLQPYLKEALDRIKIAGGKARFILVNDTNEPAREPATLMRLAGEYPEVLEIVQALCAQPVAHFMVADDNMIRVEEKHGVLTPESLETEIRAKVFFDEKPVAKGYINLFEKIWITLKKRHTK